EYQERTLYTTWEISYNRLMKDDLEAAAMLRIMAYFDNQSLWHGLFHAGLKDGCPLYEVISDDISFNGAMTVLADYSFLEFHPALKEWSMHKCVHDWVSASLRKAVGPQGYWYAFDCVSESMEVRDKESLAYAVYSRYVPHAKHLTQSRFLKSDIIEMITAERLRAARGIAWLLRYQTQYESAERLLKSFLQSQAAHDHDDEVTLLIMHDLGYLCLAQMKYSEAKELLGRALSGIEKIPGANDSSVARMRMNLGHVYTYQGDCQAAEQMYLQALFGKEVAADKHILAILVPLEMVESELYSNGNYSDCTCCGSRLKITANEKRLIHTVLVKDLLDISNCLCHLHVITGKKDEAELMLKQITLIRETLQGLAHSSTLRSVRNLGLLYEDQGRFDDAEKLYERVVAASEKLHGPNHYSTIRFLHDLGRLRSKQNRFEDAESLYTRVLNGLKRTFGQHNERTIDMNLHLASLYAQHGKSVAAEQIYKQALTMRETVLGLSDPLTLDIVARLGHLYLMTNRRDDAENMFLRVLEYPSNVEAQGLQAVNGFDAALKLSGLYVLTDRLHDAETLLSLMITGVAQTPGLLDQHALPYVFYSLASLWLMNGQLNDAENLLSLVLLICKLFGSEHSLMAALSESLAKVYEQNQF
ncbi:kinesin light chain, partial [Aspergillus flavus]